MSAAAVGRLLARCDESQEGCWVFRGAKNNRGYGVVGVDGRGRTALAHRLSYEYFVTSIPDGLVVDHLCRNRACVNPGHLEPVSPAENTSRGLRAAGYRDERCSNGHRYTPDNTGTSKRGRFCLTCRVASREREAAKRKGVAA